MILTMGLRLTHAAIPPINTGNYWVSRGHQLARSGHKQGFIIVLCRPELEVVKTQLHNSVLHCSAALLPSGLWKQWFGVIREQCPSLLREYFKAAILQEGRSSEPCPCIGLQVQTVRSVYPGAVRRAALENKVNRREVGKRRQADELSLSVNFHF